MADGSVFFALPGEETDGHLFAPAAAEAGAALIVAEREVAVDVPQLIVPDGVAALAAMARLVVERVRSAGRLRIVAITGSNGKTTTKNLLRSILEAEGPTVAPPGSFNNHVGAPISMLRVDEGTEYLVVEMGASHEGEIARLVAIATPDISVVLKVGLAHAGEFGGIEAIQRAKAEIVRDLPATSTAAAEPRRLARRRDGRRRPPHVSSGSVRARMPTCEPRTSSRQRAARPSPSSPTAPGCRCGSASSGSTTSRTRWPRWLSRGSSASRSSGRSPPSNRCRAPNAGAWRCSTADDGVTVINDAYNASPDSTAAAMKTLAQIITPGQRSVAVLGEMAELGEFAQEEHDRLGRLAVRLNIGKLVVVGERARHIHLAAGLEGSWDGESVLVPDVDAAYDLLREELRPGDVVLVKSSKSAGLRFLGDRLGRTFAE